MCIQMTMPFFVKLLVAYIKDGENPSGIHFPEFSYPFLARLLPPERQYGLSVTLAMLLL